MCQSMLIPIHEDRTSAAGEEIIRTISTRVAGGRKEASIEPARVSDFMVIDLSIVLTVFD